MLYHFLFHSHSFVREQCYMYDGSCYAYVRYDTIRNDLNYKTMGNTLASTTPAKFNHQNFVSLPLAILKLLHP